MKQKEGIWCGLASAYGRQDTLSVDIVDARVNPRIGKDPELVIEMVLAKVFAGFPEGGENDHVCT